MKRLFSSYPGIDGQYGRIHPLKVLLCGLLLGLVGLLGIHATRTLTDIRQHNSLLEHRTYEVPWSLMQLQREVGRFLDAVRLRHSDAISQENFLLRYDILWSRTPILLSNKFKRALDVNPDLWLLIRQIHSRVRSLEQTVQTLEPDSSQYLLILTELSPYLEPLSRNVTATMLDNVRFYAEYDQAYRQLGKQLYQQIIGLFVALSTLLLVLFRELRRYWQLQQQDPLTGLPNRFALQRHVAPMIEQGIPFSMALLELKDFNEHHHRFGYEVADKLLQACAQRLQTCLQPNEFMAQPDQDGVLILARGVVELEEARAQMSRFRQALATKVNIDEYNFYMEPIIGGVLYPADADNLVDLLARGEFALELCKQKNLPYVFFDPSLLKEMSRRQQLAKDLPAAINNHSLTLRLQPLVQISERSCCGLQLIISWHHPRFGIISATELLRIAEQYQHAERLTLWALQTACLELANWQQQSATDLFISIKLPAVIFKDGIENTLLALLAEQHISPQALVVEVNESVAMADPREAMNIMSKLAAAGVRIILTEFGTGCSALGYLSQFPLNWLQLDPLSCSGIEHPGGPRQQLETLFSIAEVLKLPLICTGVDQASELNVLESIASPLLIQGDIVTPPLFLNEVSEWLIIAPSTN
ncbi:GGDEF and EAL domain-containing protein [Oceanisphaera pacifica]|uniref:GGDEF and EAL domain-containing protein n=1 Tax=Oceanisphaera pacifica TaxID=2818389 RepID=A0ABS3NCQ0_9GAMM|nr:GGDEF and EAL domain-containing protein [Oceanisphaera pacifica]MBO1518378.1 GGDEF and EAL domain-containing protein [Oceanisphaera pacifica]